MEKDNVMFDFDKASRTLLTRDLVYDRCYMRAHGILKIFNSVSIAEGAVDYLFADPRMGGGLFLVERSYSCRGGGEPVLIVSVIVFVDFVSMNLFCIRSGVIYRGHELYFSLVN